MGDNKIDANLITVGADIINGMLAVKIKCSNILQEDVKIINLIVTIVQNINDDNIKIDCSIPIFELSLKENTKEKKMDIGFMTEQKIDVIEIYEKLFMNLALIVSDILFKDLEGFTRKIERKVF